MFVHINSSLGVLQLQEISMRWGPNSQLRRTVLCFFIPLAKCKCRWCNVHSLSLNQRAVSVPAGILCKKKKEGKKKKRVSLPVRDIHCYVNGWYCLLLVAHVHVDELPYLGTVWMRHWARKIVSWKIKVKLCPKN